jgi:nucleoside-diphosphate-sugar epimerase
MKYLVTGGAGFIGSHIVEALLERGDKVVVLDNLSTGRRENLDGFEAQPEWAARLEFVEGSIEDLGLLKRIFEGVDYVIHQAAKISVPESVENPLAFHEANVTGSLNVFLAARDAGVKRVVYASSSAVYGDLSPGLAKREDMPLDTLSPYASNKFFEEEYGRLFTRLYGLETVGLRYFNVFGSRQDPNSAYAAVIPKFVTSALQGGEARIYGDGEQSRDFVHVKNVAAANLLACEAAGVAGEVFNVASGKTVTVVELLDAIEAAAGSKAQRFFDPPREGDIKFSSADISKIRAGLGYEPHVNFEEGLRETIEWYAR